MRTITIFSERTSPRLLYVLDWLFDDRLGLKYRLTRDATEACTICYGRQKADALHIPDAGLLWEQEINKHEITTGEWKGIPTLYAKQGSVPFDILSAIFFLLSRYEEYYKFEADKHNRYPATESILYKLNCLQRPIVDEWVEAFRVMLNREYYISVFPKDFSYQPTYDIDIAWSYKNKGLMRNAGGFVKSMMSGNTEAIAERRAVLKGKIQDPYDAYDWMQQLHKQYSLDPIYFVLAAQNTGEFDKNISPGHPAMQALVRKLSRDGIVGIHPSYHSEERPALIAEEKAALEKTELVMARSRQHYIKLRFPESYRRLLSNGIRADYSMGYSTQLGFRAGTGYSFKWYNLLAELATDLSIHPFCFMDTTALYDMGLNVDTAFEKLYEMKERLQTTNSKLITVFHNFSLGSSKEWNGWKEAYSKFIASIF
jgi:hypothetical protein